eukprot:4764252-Alexandrium_andersonii.AAC.1
MFRRANCGLRQIAALACLGRIADCTLDTSRCKDLSLCVSVAKASGAGHASRDIKFAMRGFEWNLQRQRTQPCVQVV